MKGSEFRLLLAAALCALLFLGTDATIKEEDICQIIDTGTLEFYNDSDMLVFFSYSGPNEWGAGEKVEAKSYLIKHLESGLYHYSVLQQIFNQQTKELKLKLIKEGTFRISPNTSIRVYFGTT